MNIKEIKEMIKLMNDNDIREFELERDGFRIVLKRGPAESNAPFMQPMPVSAQQTVSEKAVTKTVEEEKTEDKNIEMIVAPMVGTFYTAPSPESAPYVQKNDRVNVGDVVCIVEAMKVMNEIKTEVSGIIEEILVENGEAIEFGQALFKIRKK